MKKILLYFIVVTTGLISGGPIVAIISFFTIKYLIKKNQWFTKNKRDKKYESFLNEPTDCLIDKEIVCFYSLMFDISSRLRLGKPATIKLAWDNLYKDVRYSEGAFPSFEEFQKLLKYLNIVDQKESVEILLSNDNSELIEKFLTEQTVIFYPQFGDEAINVISIYAKKLNFYSEYQVILKNLIDDEYVNESCSNEKEKNKSDPYSVLGCSHTDSIETIKKAYRRKISEFHPDKIQGKGLSQEFIDFANEQAKKINEAYESILKTRR